MAQEDPANKQDSAQEMHTANHVGLPGDAARVEQSGVAASWSSPVVTAGTASTYSPSTHMLRESPAGEGLPSRWRENEALMAPAGAPLSADRPFRTTGSRRASTSWAVEDRGTHQPWQVEGGMVGSEGVHKGMSVTGAASIGGMSRHDVADVKDVVTTWSRPVWKRLLLFSQGSAVLAGIMIYKYESLVDRYDLRFGGTWEEQHRQESATIMFVLVTNAILIYRVVSQKAAAARAYAVALPLDGAATTYEVDAPYELNTYGRGSGKARGVATAILICMLNTFLVGFFSSRIVLVLSSWSMMF
eukprot:jgi/Mesvir1/17873/Mv12949-RA.2